MSALRAFVNLIELDPRPYGRGYSMPVLRTSDFCLLPTCWERGRPRPHFCFL